MFGGAFMERNALLAVPVRPAVTVVFRCTAFYTLHKVAERSFCTGGGKMQLFAVEWYGGIDIGKPGAVAVENRALRRAQSAFQ